MGRNKSQGPPKAANRVEANRALKVALAIVGSAYTAGSLFLVLNALFHWFSITPK